MEAIRKIHSFKLASYTTEKGFFMLMTSPMKTQGDLKIALYFNGEERLVAGCGGKLQEQYL